MNKIGKLKINSVQLSHRQRMSDQKLTNETEKSFNFLNFKQFPFLKSKEYQQLIKNIEQSKDRQQVARNTSALSQTLLRKYNYSIQQVMFSVKPNNGITIHIKQLRQAPRILLRQRKITLTYQRYNVFNQLGVFRVRGTYSFMKGSSKLSASSISQNFNYSFSIKNRKPINIDFYQTVHSLKLKYRLHNFYQNNFSIYMQAKNRNNYSYLQQNQYHQNIVKNSHLYSLGTQWNSRNFKAKLQIGSDFFNSQYFTKLKASFLKKIFENSAFSIVNILSTGFVVGKNILPNDYLNPSKDIRLGQNYTSFISSKTQCFVNYPILNQFRIIPYQYLFTCLGTNTKNKYNLFTQFGFGLKFQEYNSNYLEMSLLKATFNKQPGISIRMNLGK